MLYRLVSLVPFFIGCTTFKSDADTGSTATGSSPGAGSGGITEHGGLQDLTEGLDRSGCDIQESTNSEIAGATSYYYGLFVEEGGAYSGYELWILYANETWREQGYTDCIVRWDASAFEAVPGSTAGANFGLNVTLNLDRNATTCPDDMVGDMNDSDSVHYDLQIAGGQTEWFFESGNRLGSGYANDNALNYISPKSCRWF